jgi:hypothetical protein
MTDDDFDGPLTPARLGWIIFLTMPPIYAVLTYLGFDEILLGAVAGLLTGLGIKLFLPYFMPASPSERAADTPNYGGDVRRTATGIGLAAGGTVLLNSWIVLDGYLVPLAAGAVVGLALFVPLDRFLPSEPAAA